MVTKEDLINSLTEAEVSVEDANKKFDALHDFFTSKTSRGDFDSDEAYEDNILDGISKAIKKFIRSSKTEKYVGTCIGVGQRRDASDYDRKQCLELYKNDPKTAVKEKYVKVEGDEIIPLDHKLFLDAAKTMENRNFGTPLKERFQRELIFIVDGAIVRAFGDVDATIGIDYTIFGKKSKGGSISIDKKIGIKEVSVQSPEPLWNRVIDALGDAKARIELEDINDVAKNAMVITMGEVVTVSENRAGATLVIGNEILPNVVCFANEPTITTTILGLVEYSTIIVIGKITKLNDNQTNTIKSGISLLGVICDPDSVDDSDSMEGLDELLFGD